MFNPEKNGILSKVISQFLKTDTLEEGSIRNKTSLLQALSIALKNKIGIQFHDMGANNLDKIHEVE